MDAFVSKRPGPIAYTQIVNGLLLETPNEQVAAPGASEVGPHSENGVSHIALVQHVVNQAEDVFGSRTAALEWLGTKVRALNFATPISLLSDSNGAERVLAVLSNLEHGVW